MALTRLVETYTYNPTAGIERHIITESELKNISEGKVALTENVRKYFEDRPFTMLEGKQVWRVPVSRYDWKNANGRIYGKDLWENVISSQKETWQGGHGLSDHPLQEDDGSFKDVSVVWLNMGLNEDTKTVWAECIFVGNGKLAEEVMEAGGKVGFSSSGFGELMEDGITVNPKTYLIERVADIVLNPSQNVFGEAGMKVSRESVSVSNKDTKLTETTVETTKKEEKTMSENKLSKMEERKFREDVSIYLTEAERTKDLQDRLSNLNEVLSYFEGVDMPELKTQIEDKVSETKKLIEKAVKEFSDIEETFGTSEAQALKEGIKNIAVDTKLFKRDAEEWKRIAIGLQEEVKKRDAIIESLPTAEAYKTAMNFSRRLKEIAKDKETELLNEIELRDNAIGKAKNAQGKLINEIKSLKDEKLELNEKLQYTLSVTKNLKNKIEEIKSERIDAENTRKRALQEKNRIVIAPQKKYNTSFEEFSESGEVADYYADLEERHGKKILPYKDMILGRKTLGEAMNVYVKALAEMDSGSVRKTDSGIDQDRSRMVESQTGIKIKKSRDLPSRLPDGWE
jgi:myosin heavy subunit